MVKVPVRPRLRPVLAPSSRVSDRTDAFLHGLADRSRLSLVRGTAAEYSFAQGSSAGVDAVSSFSIFAVHGSLIRGLDPHSRQGQCPWRIIIPAIHTRLRSAHSCHRFPPWVQQTGHAVLELPAGIQERQ